MTIDTRPVAKKPKQKPWERMRVGITPPQMSIQSGKIQLKNMMLKEDTSLSDHLNEFQGIIDQMSGMSIKFEDEILGLLLFNSLPESWETFKVSITNSAPNDVVSLHMKHCFLWKKENKGKKGKSKEKDDDDDHDHDHDRVTTATGDDLVILQDFELLWLRGVKHALDVCFNLISVYMLDDDGYDNHFGYGKWKLTKGNLVVARWEKFSKLYWTKALVAKDSVNAMDMEASL
ncbi:hypothetical protein CR513_23988, partial [Mucuna pruriens]